MPSIEIDTIELADVVCESAGSVAVVLGELAFENGPPVADVAAHVRHEEQATVSAYLRELAAAIEQAGPGA